MTSKSNLLINVGEEYNKKHLYRNNKNSKYNSLIFNKSLTTNTSGTTFWTPNNTIENSKITKNIFSLKNKTNSKFSSLSIFTPGLNKYKNNFFLPQIRTPTETIKILKKADNIIKYRQGKYLSNSLKQTKSTVLKKSNEICLKNFLITQIKNKREEIENIQNEITTNAEKADHQLHLDYQNFFNFKEGVSKKIKNLENEYMNTLQIKKERENILKEEISINQRLERNIENITKQIILLQNYGKFIHIVFDSPFFIEEINKYDLKEKRYLKIYKQILKMIEKNKKLFEEDSIVFNDSEELMKRFEYFEKKIVNNIKMKDEMKEEIKFIKVLNQKLLEQSYLKKNDLEKEFQSLNDVLSMTNKEINYLNNIKQNNENNFEICKEYIYDLGKYFNLESNKCIKDLSISDFFTLSKKISNFVEKKENIALGYINNIMNLINSEDRKIITDIIDERKKLIKREKYREYIDNQKIEAEKRKFKTNSYNRNIVIKGRKAFRDIPIIKKKKANIKKKINNEFEAFECLNYSSDN